MRDDLELQQALDRWQLGDPQQRVAGRAGELLGRGAGSSLEFQEYREYIPGDDVRHLDWAAYARSDNLMLRLYREEISPRTQIILDASRSMTSTGDAKPRLARQLAALFALLSSRLGGRPVVTPANDDRPLETIDVARIEQLEKLSFAGVRTLAELAADHSLPGARRAVRIVVSDFLFPHDPEALIRKLAVDAGALWIVQVLGAWEADPTPLGGRKLIDAETGVETDVVVDRQAVADYQVRLNRLLEEIAKACRRVHAPYVKLIADHGLASLCQNDLSAAGMIRPA